MNKEQNTWKLSFKKNDECYTRLIDAEFIYEKLGYLFKDKTIWLPCDLLSSNLVKVLQKNNVKIINSHIFLDQDFYNYEPKEHYDIIFTNPPFSNKTNFLIRLKELNKPFIILLPNHFMLNNKVVELYNEMDLNTTMINYRFCYETKNNLERSNQSPNFSTFLISRYLDVPKAIIKTRNIKREYENE